MANSAWPSAEKRTHIGKRVERIDGPEKVTGAAKYSFDINRPGMLYAKLVFCPHGSAEVVSVDTTAAQALPGVKGIWKEEDIVGRKMNFVGQIVAAVAATTEEIATEAASLVKVQYKVAEPLIADTDPAAASGQPSRRDTNADAGLAQAEVTITGEYGLPMITHCCLESHGQVTEITNGELHVWPSTQNVSGYANRLGEIVGVPQNKIHVDTQHMGGGFGSKFGYDKWGEIGPLLSKQTGAPVKLMLERDHELMHGGNRPSAYAKIKVGAKKDGTLTAFDTEVWGTGGFGGYNAPPVPYVLTKVPNRLVGRGIRTNRGTQRAWRAPNHPQGCYLTMSAMADMAAELKMDELDFFMKNMDLTDRPQVYRDELKIAADMIGYSAKKHLRSNLTSGPVKRGLGMAVHTWGGRGHDSESEVTITSDGSVEIKMGTQDLGVGTRTALRIVVADTLGIPLDRVEVKIGKNAYPASGASGGSTTIGGISTSARIAATNALNALLAAVAPKLGVSADSLEARDGKIRQTDRPSKALTWKEATRLIGPQPITQRGKCVAGEAERAGMISQGVGGAQIADVSVDTETGVVTMNEMVAVQDVGLIINLKLAESQVLGSLIMGITYSLFEECVYDNRTGRLLNADMEFYRLAGIKDVGKLKVHMMTGKGYDERGVIGIGEPPVISPGAAIANAVANAIGVRVPELPLTPDRVIAALQKGGKLA